MLESIKEFLRVIGEIRYIVPLLRYKWPDPDDNASLAHSFEQSVEKYKNKDFIFFEDETWTYSEINNTANILAHKLIEDGISHGDKVILFMENRPSYVSTILALNKIGAIGVLINTSLKGEPLIHCINSSNSKKCIFGAELSGSLEGVLSSINITAKSNIYWVQDLPNGNCPEWATDINKILDLSKTDNLSETNNVTAKDIAFYIFTSGTTGVPKAALFPNVKIVASSTNITRGGYRMNSEDCLYNCLPLYHSTGMMLGLCACIHVGASTFIKRKFSASSFWKEVKKYNTTAFIYVGELCRYLSLQDPVDEEKDNPITKMVGNGLRPDLWDCFRNRFCVERICEIYGASEGNGFFMNLLNKDQTIGMTNNKIELLEYDIGENKLKKDIDGNFIRVKENQPGLALVEIGPNAIFNGYTDKKASDEKIFRNVFNDGDSWFNTGDILKTMDVGFALGRKHYQFVDRVGDTFRWKSENVSTNEVAEILNLFNQVNMANVYGVKIPKSEGRAGMVAFNCELKEFKWSDFSKFVAEKLPKYAQPIFIRIIKELETTGTFKLKKNDLREEAYHLDKIKGDQIYIKKPGNSSYEVLDKSYYDIIMSGEAGF
ncbi:MAG: long-chain-acyl-CoA synthetase [Gammaproteobacteria bacterium]|tara:strand:- start:2081 stop:3889 length:1809 start_codon:yes stop_codon:yes gene_type:complete